VQRQLLQEAFERPEGLPSARPADVLELPRQRRAPDLARRQSDGPHQEPLAAEQVVVAIGESHEISPYWRRPY
jgi:hypothetical protein